MQFSIKQLSLILGPLVALVAFFASYSSQHPELAITLGVMVLCVIWWVFEPIPIPVTSLMPLAAFQLTGVLSAKEIGEAYGSPLILLLLGGFILSKAMEKSGAHLRLALFMVNLFGSHSSKRLVLGFMATAAILSMWISNTATTLMLLPVALAVIHQAKDHALATPLMLGIAYSASIGGVGTPIGTPTNLIFMQVYAEKFNQTMSFTEWMRIGLPVVILMIPLTWIWLSRKLNYRGSFYMPNVGHWQTIEKRVMLVFAITAIAWVTRQEPFGGWRSWLNLPNANDASIALLAVIAMFIIPDGKGDKLLNWEAAVKIPWGILLLFGGGITLAKAFTVSGLSTEITSHLAAVYRLPLIGMIGLLCLLVTFLTETTSNIATTVLLMPVLAAAAIGANITPELLMIPATISASFAFMMPVATAPNSIAYASGHLSVKTMAQEGFVLNLVGAVLITVLSFIVLI